MKRDPAFVWETEALRRRVGRPTAPPPAPPHEDLPGAPTGPTNQPTGSGTGPSWVTVAEAATAINSPEATVMAWADGGRVPAQDSSQGRLVLLQAVVDRATEMRQARAAAAMPSAPPTAPVLQPDVPAGSMIVPRDAWDRMLDQLGNLHEAGQQLAEARERAVKAETEAGFLKERLTDLREQLERRQPATPAASGTPAQTVPAPAPTTMRRDSLLGLVARGLRRKR
ncbi:MAG: hypothetical protein HKN93_09250 [Acidimicrobiia bacterium]|nr:hypothetical protein [Acidimicrobiia bacterium]